MMYIHKYDFQSVRKDNARDAEIFLNKQVKIKNLKNNARPNNKVYSNISYFMPVRKKNYASQKRPSSLAKVPIRFPPLPEGSGSEPWLAKMKKADLLFSSSL